VVKYSYCRRQKKQLCQTYKLLLKQVKKEIEYLQNEVKDCLKTLNGFEKFIVESIFYIKDRDNLLSSHICNTHKNRMLNIQSIISRMPAWSVHFNDEPMDMPAVAEYKDPLEKYTDELLSTTANINRSLEKEIAVVSEYMPTYIQHVNLKLIAICTQRMHLENLYQTTYREYRNCKKVKREALKAAMGQC
jgi:hypothetical protein